MTEDELLSAYGMAQLDFDAYAVARTTDPETSHEAAASVRGIRESQAEVLAALRRAGPMTDEGILVHLREYEQVWRSPSGARTRRAELVRMGKVQDSGRRERLPSGRNAIVWEAVSG